MRERTSSAKGATRPEKDGDVVMFHPFPGPE
jgi:hypothetical protein